MSTLHRTNELLLGLAHEIIDIDSQDGLMRRDTLQVLHSSLENAIGRVIAAQNGLSVIGELPPETVVTIVEFVMGQRTRESMFELVKMTHVCQHWRSVLISCPSLWTSIFVKSDPKQFITTCLERSQKLPLTVWVDLTHSGDHEQRTCACSGRSYWAWREWDNPCPYHTTILPLTQSSHIQRIRQLDVRFTMLDSDASEPGEWNLGKALRRFEFFLLPLPSLEILSFAVHHDLEEYTHLDLPGNLFDLEKSPPDKLCNLTLRGCYGGSILSARNLTSFNLAGDRYYYPIELDPRKFLSFISASPSLESLTLANCTFPKLSQLSQVAAIKLSKLKTLQLAGIRRIPGLSGLIEVPAFKTLSSFHMSTRKRMYGCRHVTTLLVRAESDDGAQLSFETLEDDDDDDYDSPVSRWSDLKHFVQFEGQDPRNKPYSESEVSPLQLFVHAKAIEISTSSADFWYPGFWDDLEKIGPQLTTLRLEIAERMEPTVSNSVEKFVKARLEGGMPLEKLERMVLEYTNTEDEAKAEVLWEEFRAGLDIDQLSAAQPTAHVGVIPGRKGGRSIKSICEVPNPAPDTRLSSHELFPVQGSHWESVSTSTLVQTRLLLIALARSIINVGSQGGLTTRDNLQALHSSLKNAVRRVIVARNELSIISGLPPETVTTIAGFVVGPQTRESMFELVKMTHVCRFWRSTLTSSPHLWTSIFVKNDHKEFIAACLERSQQLPLTVHLNLKHGDRYEYPTCTCIGRPPLTLVEEHNPCLHHTTIVPLLQADHAERIRVLEVHFTMVDPDESKPPEWSFRNALDYFGFFALPLPSLESLSFSVYHEMEFFEKTHLVCPRDLFDLQYSPPAQLRHLALHGCLGGPILSLEDLTSLELSGVEDFDRIQLNQRTFLPLISSSPSLESLTLSHCCFPDHSRPSQVTPVKLSKLKTLRLMDVWEFPGLHDLMEVPALKKLSTLHILAQKQHRATSVGVHANSDDGFHLFFDTHGASALSQDWLDITDKGGPATTFVRFGEQGPSYREKYGTEVTPLPLFTNAKVIEIGASFAGPWYPTFWSDLRNVGPQLTTLRLEIAEGRGSEVAKLVKRLVKARWEKGMPLTKLERMEYEEETGEDKAKAKELWEGFRAGLDIDQYLATE